MTSIKNSQYIYDRIASKNKGILYLRNSFHVITADQQRETAAEKMREFFDRIAADFVSGRPCPAESLPR